MSGAAREGFDLFNEFGRKHFIKSLKRGHFNSLMWRDTFGQVLCKFIGHKLYDTNAGGCPPDMACKRCCKFISK